MTQDDVGKDVTLKALKSLQNLLMERIGYFDMNSELKDHLKSGITEYSDLVELLPEIQFGLRNEIEIGDLKLQPIPVAIVMNSKHDKVLVIKKSRGAVSNHSPEKDKLLLYVGGHTRFEDQTWDTKNSFLELCKSTLRREIKEEIGITVALENIVPFFIYDKSNDKSLRHLAVCFPIELDESTQLHLDAHELVLNKGRSKSGKFNDVCTLERDKMESWSRLLMDKFFASCSENETRQMTIEDYL